MQLREVVPDTIHKYPKRRASTNEEGMPPPIIVLRAELDVDRHDGDLGDCDDEDDGHDGEEAEDVVVAGFILPQGLEDEEQLDEDDCEGDETAEEDGLRGADIPRLDRHLTWNDSRFGRMLPGACTHVAVP